MPPVGCLIFRWIIKSPKVSRENMMMQKANKLQKPSLLTVKISLELENQKLGTDEETDKAINSKIFVLKDEVKFLEKVVTVVKDLKS